MYFVYRNGEYIDVSGESFHDFMAGKLPQVAGITPMMADWEDQLTLPFPEVRLKRFLEMRGAPRISRNLFKRTSGNGSVN